MIRMHGLYKCVLTCWPRTSGDDPQAVPAGAAGSMLAPHERG